MLVVEYGGVILDGTGQEVEGVDDSSLRSDLWFGEVFVEYLNSVRDDDGFGCCVDDLKAEVVLDTRAYGETFAAAEVPISAGD